MILYLNGSPKCNFSNSSYFISLVNDSSVYHLYKDSFSIIPIKDCSTIVFSFPLYIDCLPNKVIEFIEYLDSENISIENKNIYVICNCGFLEAKQNYTAVKIIKNICKKKKANYMGSFSIGAGEVVGDCKIKKLYKVICISFFIKIKRFKNAINSGKKIDISATIHPMTKKIYKFFANSSFRKRMCKF